ncbi:MAG: response regulator [candidate division WOR-3 bacterium]
MRNKIRIYLLDDSITVTTFLSKSLTSLGYVVYADNDPNKCIKRIKEFLPDIIILDIDLNEFNGIDICREIQEDEQLKEIPVIFLSHLTDTAIVAEGLEAGAVDYIYKPIDINQLDSRIKIILKMIEDMKDNIKLAKMNIIKASVITMHHELNQPLSVILLSTEMLEKKLGNKLTEKEKKLIERIKNSLNKINDILKRFAVVHEQDPELIPYTDDSQMIKLPPSTKTEKVLIIDDEREVRESIIDVLNEEGIETIQSENIKDAIEIIEKGKEKISMIFCDIRIKNESGSEVFHLVRKNYPDIKFIFITGYSIPAEVKRIIREFKIPLLKKPFSRRSILSLLKKMNQ